MYKTKRFNFDGYIGIREYREGKGSLDYVSNMVTEFLNTPESLDDIEPISIQYIPNTKQMAEDMSCPIDVTYYTAILLYKEI